MMSNIALILVAAGVVLISIIWSRLKGGDGRRPQEIAKRFREQGVGGPEYASKVGNLDEIAALTYAGMGIELDVASHDILPRVLPHYHKWISLHGRRFVYWAGGYPRLCVTEAELAKQVLSNKFGYFTKGTLGAGPLITLLGRGLVLTDGAVWARHRKVVSPAFSMDKLKMMVKQMAELTRSLLDGLEQDAAQEGKAVEMNSQFMELTADVISHCAFGSSYLQGKEVFSAQKELLGIYIASANKYVFPGSHYLPTEPNIKTWKIGRRMRNILMDIINGRLKSKEGYGNDLLGMMLESTKKEGGAGLTTDEIVDECKTFFFAGHETTSHLLTWTMFLLSTNPEWQGKCRDEVVSECGREIPTADNLPKFKLVTMVLQEALRLYPPVIEIMRETSQDVKLGDILVPKHTGVAIPFPIIHRDKDLWGDDANEFNPLRFKDGVKNAAKHPTAMLGFSTGPRVCIGQDFAMLEAKTVIAMFLQRFSFSLSPEYKHKPTQMLTLQPQDGLPVVLKTLST